MIKYKVIKKCFWNSRKWNVGDVVMLDTEPPHHLTRALESDVVNRNIEKIKDNGWRGIVKDTKQESNKNEIKTYYDMAMANSKMGSSGGFASSVAGGNAITNPKDFKNKGAR